MTFLILNIILLITFSVLVTSDRSSRLLDSLDKTNSKPPDKYEVQEQNLHVFCNLCKTAVYKMMVLVKKRIDQEIKILCGKSKYSRKTCKQQANKYKALLIRWIFHAKNARESCVNMHLC